MGSTYGIRRGEVLLVGLIFIGGSCNLEQHSTEYSTDEDDTDSTVFVSGETWSIDILPSKDTPDLEVSFTQLFIPEGVNTVQGVVVFSDHALGEDEYTHEDWRTSAQENGYAVMKVHLNDIHGNVTSFSYPDQSAKMLVDIFKETAMLSKHPELEKVPFVFFGHSAGGFLATRLIAEIPGQAAGFVAFHGCLESEALFEPEALSVPGLILIAEYDLKHIREGAIEMVEKGRAEGARWSLVVERGAGHWDIDPGRFFIIDFVEEVFRHRVRSGIATADGATPLTFLPENTGWLGRLEHQAIYGGDEQVEGEGREAIVTASISSYVDFAGSPSAASWIISESHAQNWLRYEMPSEGK